jgi:PAS domain S-box-containing protein
MATYQTDDKGKCTYVSDEFCRLFGMTRRAALDLGWMERVHPEDLKYMEAQRAHAMAPLSTLSSRFRILVHEEVKWIEAFSTAMMRGDDFIGRSGIALEIGKPAKIIPLTRTSATVVAGHLGR